MKQKKQINLIPFYDLEGMEHHLEQMAGKGWFLKKPGVLFWTYEEGKPKKIFYRICLSGESDAYTSVPGAATFRSQAEGKGWKPVLHNEKMEIYASEAESEPNNEFHVNPYDRILGVQQAAKPWLFFYSVMMVLGLLGIFLSAFKLKIMPVALLSSSMGMIVPLIFLMLGAYFLYDLIFYFRWKNKAEIAATKGEYAGVSAHPAAVLRKVLLAAGILLLFAGVTSGGSSVFMTFFIWLAILLVLLFLFRVIHRQMGKTQKSGSRLFFLSLNVLMAVILIFGISFGMNSIRAADKGYMKELPLTAQHLHLTEEGKKAENFSRTQTSFLLRRQEASQVVPDDAGSPSSILSYELVESGILKVDGMVLDHYLSRMDQTGVDSATGETVHICYEPMAPDLWQARSAWQLSQDGEPKGVYLVLYDNCLLEIGAQEAFSDAQIEIIGNLMNK